MEERTKPRKEDEYDVFSSQGDNTKFLTSSRRKLFRSEYTLLIFLENKYKLIRTVKDWDKIDLRSNSFLLNNLEKFLFFNDEINEERKEILQKFDLKRTKTVLPISEKLNKELWRRSSSRGGTTNLQKKGFTIDEEYWKSLKYRKIHQLSGAYVKFYRNSHENGSK